MGKFTFLWCLRDMYNFHQNYKDKDTFLKSGYNFWDWGYLDPPPGPKKAPF